MDEATKLFTRFTNLMDQNIRGVQIGCYSVAFVGLTIALRKVRPLSRFKRPSDIPNHFIKERRELTGLVERIEPNGALLMIQHKPLVQIPGINSSAQQLPVKISGVNVYGHGISWLQAIVAGNEVKFIPVLKEKDYVQCEVLLPQQTLDKKEQIINVGESLVKIGFGETVTIGRPLIDDKNFLSYYYRLQTAQTQAIRKKMGLKYYIKPTKNALELLLKNINQHVVKPSIQFSKKASKKAPKLVAM